ncbi:heavy-metal-associated domain-containing protein [Chitinophaga rhizosphaerae]|uniref:heavy-metal-associated domain-containing protein n=1 Tax=Chitinophaga rhizosphaerae TaxID=1864947 RepID=UPI000F803465|nr:heavy metal-associated domain-containing protein [Chitinophaga rhizosphaerae]
MKTILFALALTGITFSASAQQYKKASLQAAGLTCAMCSNATQKALKTLTFVDRIDTDLNTTTFILHFKPGVNVNIDQIRQKVEGAGFSVGKLVMTADFNGMKVENDTHVPFGGQTLHFVNVKPQTLSGEKDVTVIDRDFLPAKSFRKYAAFTKMKCINTGVMESCCGNDRKGTRVYHVTI